MKKLLTFGSLVLLGGALTFANFDQYVSDLKSPDVKVRKKAVEKLNDLDDQRAVPELAKLTKDPDKDVRAKVVEALGELGGPEALAPLQELARDPESDVRKDVPEAIMDLYYKPSAGEIVSNIFSAFLESQEMIVDDDVVIEREAQDTLKLMLADKNADVRARAANALGVLRVKPAVEQLAAALTDSDAEVRETAAAALGKIGDPKAGAALTAALNDKQDDVKAEAAIALGRCQVHGAAETLKSYYLKKTKDNFRTALMRGMAYLGDKSLADIYFQGLNDKEEDVQRYAAEGFGRLGKADDNARTALETLYLSKKTEDRVKAAVAFGLFRIKEDEAYLRFIGESFTSVALRNQVSGYLEEIGKLNKVKVLFPLLKHNNHEVRGYTAKVLGKLRDASALAELTNLLKDPDEFVVDKARVAINKIEAAGN